ncbi:2-oxo acid dehydrogenase subunit E2 [Pseudonocardia kujensis]|uniref:dihydrolipoamide acetyltransferase family protein n=1 Tax=Pseudonocardia kujensis TaxID=1128675 RepID=UPI001E36CEF9|nr:dihydrolipoamide acetyltransferase family protein [Pseudonocardia kujensis]MCE0763277.1 2-oxo acid dehydrogenase subunit E2 [Pseudonocardia kujensis]
MLVGYGPTETSGSRRRRKAPASATNCTTSRPAVGRDATLIRVKPPVRKPARDLGVDLRAVPASGPSDTITRDDVLRFAEPSPATGPMQIEQSTQPVTVAPTAPPAQGQAEALTTRIPVRGVRKATAAAMVGSAFTAPHVTEFVTVDVTRSVKLVDKLKAERAFEGSQVTMLLLVAQALLAAVREFPDINASWDQQANEIVQHHQVNLGIAAATPRGLMVPNIKNAGALSLPGLAGAMTELVRTARGGRSTPEDMSRGTITVTNIGVFGVDAGIPILNPGEAAILCVGAVRRTPWEHKGAIALRWTTQLALSFDHRLVDGELGSKVLARVGKILENPKWNCCCPRLRRPGGRRRCRGRRRRARRAVPPVLDRQLQELAVGRVHDVGALHAPSLSPSSRHGHRQ